MWLYIPGIRSIFYIEPSSPYTQRRQTDKSERHRPTKKKKKSSHQPQKQNTPRPRTRTLLTLWEPQFRFGDKPPKFQVVYPQNGTAVLKGLYSSVYEHIIYVFHVQMQRGEQAGRGERYRAERLIFTLSTRRGWGSSWFMSVFYSLNNRFLSIEHIQRPRRFFNLLLIITTTSY